MSIEGIPVIIRFKTLRYEPKSWYSGCIEGIPVIIRFKTLALPLVHIFSYSCIEGIPVIIRFKTEYFLNGW